MFYAHREMYLFTNKGALMNKKLLLLCTLFCAPQIKTMDFDLDDLSANGTIQKIAGLTFVAGTVYFGKKAYQQNLNATNNSNRPNWSTRLTKAGLLLGMVIGGNLLQGYTFDSKSILIDVTKAAAYLGASLEKIHKIT